MLLFILVLINLQYQNLAYFLENYIGVIDFTTEENGNIKFNIYFSGNIYHSSVILLNLVDDTIARWKIGESGGIETTYVPIRRYIIGNLENCYVSKLTFVPLSDTLLMLVPHVWNTLQS